MVVAVAASSVAAIAFVCGGDCDGDISIRGVAVAAAADVRSSTMRACALSERECGSGGVFVGVVVVVVTSDIVIRYLSGRARATHQRRLNYAASMRVSCERHRSGVFEAISH